MDNQAKLTIMKEVQGIFDTISQECEMASKFAIDRWADFLQTSDQIHPISFTQQIHRKVDILTALLYSVRVKVNEVSQHD